MKAAPMKVKVLPTGPSKTSSKQIKKSVGLQVHESLNSLMLALNSTTPLYTRCIKSNNNKMAFTFNPAGAIQHEGLWCAGGSGSLLPVAPPDGLILNFFASIKFRVSILPNTHSTLGLVGRLWPCMAESRVPGAMAPGSRRTVACCSSEALYSFSPLVPGAVL